MRDRVWFVRLYGEIRFKNICHRLKVLTRFQVLCPRFSSFETLKMNFVVHGLKF